MGRVSVKKDKSVYQLFREECGLTREKASELMDGMTASRIEKIVFRWQIVIKSRICAITIVPTDVQ